MQTTSNVTTSQATSRSIQADENASGLHAATCQPDEDGKLCMQSIDKP